MKPTIRDDTWRTLFAPRQTGCYVNDHTVFQDQDGTWYVIGITKATPEIDADNERYFCFGRGGSLSNGDFEELHKLCDFGQRAWAPTVAFNGRRYVMLYGPDIMRAAVSDELMHWRRTDCSVAGAPIDANIRDQMILRLDDRSWLLYATGLYRGNGAVSVSISEDLLHWRFVRFALVTTDSAPLHPPWGATESPFVFRKDDSYYLSVTYTDGRHGPADYHNTLLFRSPNPFDFGTYDGGETFASLYAHAPEYVCDPEDGQWYVTSCGWHGQAFQPILPGAVAITELDWQ